MAGRVLRVLGLLVIGLGVAFAWGLWVQPDPEGHGGHIVATLFLVLFSPVWLGMVLVGKWLLKRGAQVQREEAARPPPAEDEPDKADVDAAAQAFEAAIEDARKEGKEQDAD